MSGRQTDFRIDLQQKEFDNEFLKSVSLYKNADLTKALQDRMPSITGGDLLLKRQTSATANPEGGNEEFLLSQTTGSRNKSNSPIDFAKIQRPKISIKETIQRSAMQFELPDESLYMYIMSRSKFDTLPRFDIKMDKIVTGLAFDLTPLPEPQQPKIVKFNESGNKTLKYSYNILSGFSFDNTPDTPMEELQMSFAQKNKFQQPKIRAHSSSEHGEAKIDTNEDDLDGFSDAEYSVHAPADDNVDRPEKIRKLMEKQLKITQQEEKFLKKLESLKKNLEGGRSSNPPSDRLNLTVTELQMLGQKVLVEATSANQKHLIPAAEQQAQPQIDPTHIDEKYKDNDFVMKFQNYVAEENSKEAQKNENPLRKSIEQLKSQPLVPLETRQSQSQQGDKTTRNSELESMQFKSISSELDPNFQNVKSLNFFINPPMLSSNFIKTEYMEYVGINHANYIPPLPPQNLSRNADFLKNSAHTKLSQKNNPLQQTGSIIALEDLTAPKKIDQEGEHQSMFSEGESGQNENNFPFNQEPPSESFDYYKQNDSKRENQEDGGSGFPKVDQNPKQIYSDYHHYNQGYFSRFYQNYAEDIDTVYRKEVPGFNNQNSHNLNPEYLRHMTGGNDMPEVEPADGNPDLGKLVRGGLFGEATRKGKEQLTFSDKINLFKNDILDYDNPPQSSQPESEKGPALNTQDFEATKYFSFTG